jgi:hypothetical protein
MVLLDEGLERLKERDGMPQAEAVRRAIREFLPSKGITLEKADRRHAPTRKRC